MLILIPMDIPSTQVIDVAPKFIAVSNPIGNTYEAPNEAVSKDKVFNPGN